MDKIFVKNPDMVFRKIAEEMILVPIRNNVRDLKSIYTLNEVANRIWDLIDGQRNVREIRDVIVEEFDVALLEAENDLKEFLQKLEEVNGIKEA